MYIKISEDKAVKPVMKLPNIVSGTVPYDSPVYKKWLTDNHLLTLPTFEVPDSMKSLPVGSELIGVVEVEEVLLSYGQRSTWCNLKEVDWDNFDLETFQRAERRIILSPLVEGKKEEGVNQRDENIYDSAWPLNEVLEKLISASEYLLHKKDYDGPDYEEIEICVKRAKQILSSPPADQQGEKREEVKKHWAKFFDTNIYTPTKNNADKMAVFELIWKAAFQSALNYPDATPHSQPGQEVMREAAEFVGAMGDQHTDKVKQL